MQTRTPPEPVLPSAGLELGGRQGADEPADPLVRPVGPRQRVEDEQVAEGDG